MPISASVFFNRRMLLSVLVASTVAAYGYRLLGEQEAEAEAGKNQHQQVPMAPVLRLFFVTFAATYVLDYIVVRCASSSSSRATLEGQQRQTGGGGGGGGGASLETMLRHADFRPPGF